MQNHNSKFKRDLKERCFEYGLNLINFISTLPKNRVCWTISDQLSRSGLSIGANLVEAGASSSRLEFKKFHEIALKSANETKYWLLLLIKSNNCDYNEASKLLAETTEIANMLASGIMRLKGKK